MSRVSYVMMNPGGDRNLTEAVRTALDELIDELCADAARPPRPCARDRARRQPDHAPHRARHRPHAARARRRSRSPPPRPSRVARRAVRPALPHAELYLGAVHRRPRRRRHRGGHPRRGPAPLAHRCSCSSTSAPTPRSCSATRTAPVRRQQPHRPGVRGRPAQLRPARHGRRHRARPHRPRHARAALQGHRQRPVERRARLRRGVATSTSRASAARASSRSIAEMYLAGIIDQDGVVQGAARRSHAAHRRRRPHVQLRRRTRRDGVRLSHHPERRARHPAGQGRAACGHRAAHRARRLTELHDIRLAGAFGSHIDPLYALVLGLVPDCPVAAGALRRQRRRRRRVRALLSVAARARWKPPCATW